jgi:hypothetical protein
MPKIDPEISPTPSPGSRPIWSGTVRNSETGYPIENMLVQAHFIEAPPEDGREQEARRLLGSAVSGVDGEFTLAWLSGRRVARDLCLLAACPNERGLVSVSAGKGQPTLLDTGVESSTNGAVHLDLLVPIPQSRLTHAQWAEVGARSRTAGIVRLDALVRELMAPSTRSIFGDRTSLERQNAVAELETAFLDPRHALGAIIRLPAWQALAAPGAIDNYRTTLGAAAQDTTVRAALDELERKVDAFPAITEVDWQIDTSLFERSPAQAITAHQGDYLRPFPQPVIIGEGGGSDVGYRDYLRNLWTGAVVLVQPNNVTVTQAEAQLRNRFHQDFRTPDTTQSPPNEILIPILSEILTAPPGATFGFGLPAASLPARGAATARAYLDTLIGLTGVGGGELSLRYRTGFMRADGGVSSSPVWENIRTLQGFFRDSFQSVLDPAHTAPDVFGQPIVPDEMKGKAPFFLEYDEWVFLQKPVPYENYVQVRDVFHMEVGSEARTILQNLAGAPGSFQSQAKLHFAALALNDDLQKAYALFDQGEFKASMDSLNAIWTRVGALIQDPNVDTKAVAAEFVKRRGKTIASMDDLYFPVDAYGDPGLLTMWQDRGFTYDGNPSDNDLSNYFGFYTLKLACALVYLYYFAIPTIIAQAALAFGRHAEAVRWLGRAAWRLVGAGAVGDSGGWSPNWSKTFELYVAGDLPYTVETARLTHYPSFDDDDSKYFGAGSSDPFYQLVQSLVPNGLHAVERAYYRLQMGEAMLGWADTLYRANDASSISRARELYKGVYFLHGATPPINPSWGQIINWPFFPGEINPARASQLARARLGFEQIEAGLNFFGYADDIVPIQRYSTLITAANAFAADAKSAEQDFLNAMSQIEAATIDNMKNAAMLKRAQLQIQAAQQQAVIANDQVTQANTLIAQVNQQIAKAQKDIDDHDSFFGQLGDYISGLGSIAKGAKDAGDAYQAGKGVLDNSSVSEAAGFYGSDSTNALAIGGGATILGAYAAFAVASYVTLSSMADAANQRTQQLQALQNQNLVSANAQLDIARHQVTIAQLARQIAQADADLATNLLIFAQERYLSIEFWSYMAALFQRTMRRYLDFGARAGWLAQRALSYEQNTPVNIVGFDYYPAQYLGAGGADELQLDLASVEAQYLSGLREMVPLKLTYSLARDFPLQMATLRKSGSCQFKTSDVALQAAYPGMYGFRLRAVSPRFIRSNAGAPMRGVLANSGVSQISRADGGLQPSVRPADGLPVTDFDIGSLDLNVFGLPGATLMQFEGSGVETVWELVLPPAANPGGLDVLGDVVLTFNVMARFSPTLYQTVTGSPLLPASKMILVSGARTQLAGLANLQKDKTADLTFDLGSVGLPAVEKTRKLNNLFVVLVGAPKGATIAAELRTQTPATTVNIDVVDGVAYSNAAPITDPLSVAPPSPLNALGGIDVGQAFTVHVSKAANPGVNLGTVVDVLLGVDYTATY